MDTPDLDSWLSRWDIRSGAASEEAEELFHAAPGGVRTTVPFSSTNRWQTLDTDSESGCIRSVEHAYTSDGCLAVLKGNLAPDGAVVKTAGVPEHQFEFTGPASIGPPDTNTVGMFKRSAASSIPGVILSQLEMHTRASAQCAFTMNSTLSAMISRLGRE